MTEPFCTATLTTATETDEALVNLDDFCSAIGSAVLDIPDGVAVICRGDRLLRLDLHPLTCEYAHPPAVTDPAHACLDARVVWRDDTPGATPHVPTVEVSPPVEVSDAEVVAAAKVLVERRAWDQSDTDDIRAALVAAYEAREVEA